jgi:phospholipid N-methyltransferase
MTMGKGARISGVGSPSTNGPGQRVRFLLSFLRHPRQVGSVIPTSRRAVRAMLDLVNLDEASCVVEMGAGTGPHTREVLARLGPDATFLAFEIDPVLAEGLERELADPRLQVICDSAENAERYLNGKRADVVVSAVPFTSLPEEVRTGLLNAGRDSLAEDGTMLVLQYSPFMRSQLEKTFDSVRWKVAPFNVPPAFLFACRQSPRDAG